MAADLERHLANEPVSAVSPSLLYKFRKFARRNRATVAIGIVVVLGMFVSTWQAVRATRSQAVAEREAATTEAAIRFIEEDLFGNARLQPEVKLIDALEVAANRMGDRYTNQPLVEAAVQFTVGKCYVRLRAFPQAQQHLSRAIELYSALLGPEHGKTLEAKLELAGALLELSKFEPAEALGQEVLRLRMARLGLKHEDTLKALVFMGYFYDFTAQHGEAEKTLRQALETALQAQTPNYEIVHKALGGLAWVATSTGKTEELIQLRQEAFRIAREHFGPDDPQTLMDACYHAQNLRIFLKRFEESAGLAGDTHERSVRVLGENHWTTLWTLLEIAQLDSIRGFQVTAELKQILERATDALGPQQWNTLYTQWMLGKAMISDGYFEEGTTILLDAQERNHAVEGLDTYLSRSLSAELAEGYTVQGRFSEAETQYRQLLAVERGVLGPEATSVKARSGLLANLLARQGKWSEASQTFAACGILANEDIASGLMAARLANHGESLRRFGNQALKRLQTTEDSAEAFDLAQALLLTLDRIPSVESREVIRASERSLNLQTDPDKHSVLATTVAWRNNDWSRAREQAQHLAAHLDGRIASLGDFILAISSFRQGDLQPALESLVAGQGRLGQVMLSGDLGKPWWKVAAALLASDEISSAVQGLGVEPRVEPANLAEARLAWQPVQALLEQAGWAARRQEWNDALDAYRRAMAQPQFSWDAATVQDRFLADKLATVFVVTGQANEYLTFRHDVVHPGRVMYLLPGFPVGEMGQSALQNARRSLEAIGDDPKFDERRHWHELTVGLAEYRNGNLTDAFRLLERSAGAFNLNCSGTAAAFAAMAAHRSGMGEPAHDLLAEAEQAQQHLMERNVHDLGPEWSQTVILQIAISEARSTLVDR